MCLNENCIKCSVRRLDTMLNIEKMEQLLSDNSKLLVGMKKYKRIIEALHWTDVSIDKDFQRSFNDFFVMRSRKGQYYDMFYSFLEQKKNKGVSFEETPEYLKEAEGHLEISFSSKLIHIINPNRPIWDNNVAIQHFEVKLTSYDRNGSIRQKEIVKAYHEYCSRFYEYLDSSEGQAVLRLFNDKYPHTGFTDTKKIVFLMWVDI